MLVENCDFFIPLAFDAPLGGSPSNIVIMFGMGKLMTDVTLWSKLESTW